VEPAHVEAKPSWWRSSWRRGPSRRSASLQGHRWRGMGLVLVGGLPGSRGDTSLAAGLTDITNDGQGL
jgi:hypothetical protein